jgi:hypothetical protein
MSSLKLALVSLALLVQSNETLPTILAKLDVSCILKSWRIKGVRVCMKGGKPVPCVVIENAYPVGILESVKQSYFTQIAEIAPALKAIKTDTTSSHTSGLEFSETRVYMFVPSLPAPLPLAMPPTRGWSLAYVSELDRFSYRNPIVEHILKAPQIASTLPSCTNTNSCCGTWGAYYPRIGFVNHPSHVIASYLVALRAARIAHDPSGHVSLARYPYEPRTGHYLQPLGHPCFTIGSPATLAVERGKGSLAQSHLLIHYGIFEECKPCFDSRLVEARRP